MASTEVITLSSSPKSMITITPVRECAPPMVSSPAFPSPSQLFHQERTAVPSGSRANPVPDVVTKGFTSAVELLEPELANDKSTTDIPQTKPTDLGGWEPPAHGTRGISETATKVVQGITEKALKKKTTTKRRKNTTSMKKDDTTRQSLGLLEGDQPVGFVSLKEKGAKKGTEGPEIKVEQRRIAKSGLTEGTLRPPRKTKIAKKLAETANDEAHARVTRQLGGPKEDLESLGLNKVIKRRKERTPIKDHSHTGFNVDISTSGGHLSPQLKESPPSPVRSQCFENLVNNFECKQDNEAGRLKTITPRNSDGQAMTKRRKIDLISSIIYPQPSTNPTKPIKVAKKKPQTITGKATEHFVAAEALASPLLLQYFSPPAQLNEDPGGGQKSDDIVRLPRIVKKKAILQKSPKPKAKKPKAKTHTPILLPPEEAILATKGQDLLFGTSSQLTREESPSFVREIQQALRASELSSLVRDPTTLETVDLTGLNSTSKAKTFKYTSSRNLWSVAARDSKGSLLDIETLDLATAPSAKQPTITISDPVPLNVPNNTAKPITENETYAPYAVANGTIPQVTTALEHADLEEAETSTLDSRSIPRSIAEAALRERPKSRSPVKKDSLYGAQDNLKSKMPPYQGWTIAKLTKAVTAFGFKSIKNRDTMIKLLEQCWEGQQRLALQSLPPNGSYPKLTSDTVTNSTTKSFPSKRKGRLPKASARLQSLPDDALPTPKARGRPRKELSTVAATVLIEPSDNNKPISKGKKANSAAKKRQEKVPLPPPDEIDDPNPPPTPSPPRRRTTPVAPKALLLTARTLTTSTKPPDPLAARADLFAKITEAITTFPSSHDPEHLTWHEKILLYDPIVLEDLAAWLNTIGLGRVGVDEEVGALEVRAWCEERSVCCLWKANLRGGERSRF